MSRHCPRCGTEARAMAPVRDRGLTIDYCGGCHGIWLDRDEWTPIVGHARSVTQPHSIPFGTAPPPCPACAAEGVQPVPGLVPRGLRGLGDLEIDICLTCGGGWLDGGELKTLQERLPHVEPERTGRELPEGVRAPDREERAMSFLEALRDSWSNLWR